MKIVVSLFSFSCSGTMMFVLVWRIIVVFTTDFFKQLVCKNVVL